MIRTFIYSGKKYQAIEDPALTCEGCVFFSDDVPCSRPVEIRSCVNYFTLAECEVSRDVIFELID